MPGAIRIGVGGWSFEPWRGVFYPRGLAHRRELEFASRALTSIEINGTYYSTFKPDSWCKWRDETPDDFVFSVKASRYATNRKVLGEAGEAIERFLGQGLTALGPKLGPINWQLMATKKLDLIEMARFLTLLPKERDGVSLRHAIEVRHPSFAAAAFYDLAREHDVAIVHASGAAHPEIDEPTAGFTYARFMSTRESQDGGVTGREIDGLSRHVKARARRGDVFAYFIAGAKVHNPAAAMTLISKVGGQRPSG